MKTAEDQLSLNLHSLLIDLFDRCDHWEIVMELLWRVEILSIINSLSLEDCAHKPWDRVLARKIIRDFEAVLSSQDILRHI